MQKITDCDLDDLEESRKVVSYGQIDSFSRTRFAYPMAAVDSPKKGVYANLDEFKENQPSISDYEIKKSDNGEMELWLRDAQGEFYYSHKMWGYSDGEHCYVMMDGNLYPLFLIHHAWYVWGSKEYKVKKRSSPLIVLFPSAIMLASVPISESVSKKMRFFTLDTDSGDIY